MIRGGGRRDGFSAPKVPSSFHCVNLLIKSMSFSLPRCGVGALPARPILGEQAAAAALSLCRSQPLRMQRMKRGDEGA